MDKDCYGYSIAWMKKDDRIIRCEHKFIADRDEAEKFYDDEVNSGYHDNVIWIKHCIGGKDTVLQMFGELIGLANLVIRVASEQSIRMREMQLWEAEINRRNERENNRG